LIHNIYDYLKVLAHIDSTCLCVMTVVEGAFVP
jgi:hypothetical protein